MVRGLAPVASSTLSYSSVRPSDSDTVRAVRSRAVARVDRCRVTSLSTYHCSVWTKITSSSSLPVSTPFDSGGRSYGSSGSAPTRWIAPSKPSERSVSAAFAAVSPPPISR